MLLAWTRIAKLAVVEAGGLLWVVLAWLQLITEGNTNRLGPSDPNSFNSVNQVVSRGCFALDLAALRFVSRNAGKLVFATASCFGATVGTMLDFSWF